MDLGMLPYHVRKRVQGFKIQFDYPWPREDWEIETDEPIGLLDGLSCNLGAIPEVKEIVITSKIMDRSYRNDETMWAWEFMENFTFHWRPEVADQIKSFLLDGSVSKVIVQIVDAPEEVKFRLEDRTSILHFFRFLPLKGEELEQIDVQCESGDYGYEWHFTRAASNIKWVGSGDAFFYDWFD